MFRLAAPGVAAAAAAIGLAASALSAPSPFSAFVGSWNGNGQVRLQDGRGEQIKCRAYYTERGATMGLALRCASSGSKIDLRAQLAGDGQRVTGTWEERQFNAAGSLSGTQSGSKLSLVMEGGGLTASVTVSASGGAQSFIISTDAGTVRGAQISLVKVPD